MTDTNAAAREIVKAWSGVYDPLNTVDALRIEGADLKELVAAIAAALAEQDAALAETRRELAIASDRARLRLEFLGIAEADLVEARRERDALRRAAEKRLVAGHNGTCDAEKGDSEGDRYPCSCGHASLRAALRPEAGEGA